MCCALTLLCYAVVVQPAGAGTRAKTDIITLRNGDRLTGRIIVAQYGYLQLDSAHSGTVQIEWPSVRSIESRYQFRVVRFGGLHYEGPIHTTSDGLDLIVGNGPQAVSVPMKEVTSLVPYESSFWKRIDGSVSAGYSFTKASGVSQGNVGFTANYSGSDVEATLNGSTLVTRDTSGRTTDQDQIAGAAFFLEPSPNFWGFLGSLQRDRDLGVDGRLVTGAVLGRRLFETPSQQAVAIIGLAGNGELAAGSGSARGSLEGVLGAQWRIYRFTYPKVSLDASLLLYPSITDSPRLRGSLNIALTYKLTERFALRLSEYGNYDSRPPQSGAETFDYGVVTSIAYSFGPVIE